MTLGLCCLRCKRTYGSSSVSGHEHLLYTFPSSQGKKYDVCVFIGLGTFGPLLDPSLVKNGCFVRSRLLDNVFPRICVM